ncbi:MAG: hypothetical protein ACO2PM_16935 [Pyrobaculum sp.]|jgi:hypothetical protein
MSGVDPRLALAAAKYLCHHRSVGLLRLTIDLLKDPELRETWKKLGVNPAQTLLGGPLLFKAAQIVQGHVQYLEYRGVAEFVKTANVANWKGKPCHPGVMTCRELLQRFIEALERSEVDWETLSELKRRCGQPFALEAWKAFAEKLTRLAMSEVWSQYRDAVLAGEPPTLAYAEALHAIWKLWDKPLTCTGLSHVAVCVAKAAAEYNWPAAWPFPALFVAAIKERGCELPDAVAEALGPDEWARLESFLEDEVGVVEVGGRKAVIIRAGQYFGVLI